MITELSSEQEARLNNFRKDLFESVSGYGETDRNKTETLINRLYVEMGYLQPQKIIWFDSPLKALNAIEIFCRRQTSFNFLSRTPEVHFKEQLLDQHPQMSLGNSLFLSFYLKSLKSEWKLESKYRRHNFLESSVNEELLQSLDFLVYLEGYLITNVDGCFSKNTSIKDLQTLYLGQYNLKWVAFYLYYNLLGARFDENTLKALFLSAAVAQSCCWWWPFENIVIICDRPKVEWDNDEQIHAIEKPAIKFRDGWSLYAFHGTTIPKEWGEKKEDEWEPEWLLKTDNQEYRRILVEVCGYEKIMHKLNSELIDAVDSMELRRIVNIDVEAVLLLKVKCPSTNAFYCLRVPPYMRNCETARQWTFGDESIKFLKET